MSGAIAQRPLGRSGLTVTALGLGCGPLGGQRKAVTDDAAVATVHAAHASGVRYFDVAPLYGHGRSEQRLGRALQRIPRDDIVVSTKVGRLLVPTARADVETRGFDGMPPFDVVFDYSGDGTRRSVAESLGRLGLDRIDIALIHDIDRWTHGDAQPAMLRAALDGAYPALRSLKDEGVIGAVGLGVNEVAPCIELAGRAEIDCVLIAGRYTLLDRAAGETLLPFCADRGIGVIVGGPFNSGILAAGSGADALYNYAPAPPEIRDRVRRLEAICEGHNVPLAAAALQFILRHPAVASVIPGAASPDEARRNADLLDCPIPDTLWSELERV